MGSSTSATPDPSTQGAGRGYQPNVNSPDPQQQTAAVPGGVLTSTVLAGSGIAVSNAGGDVTVSSSGGGVTSIVAGQGISVSGSGAVTVSAVPLATAYETQLTDTNLDTVATFTPTAAGVFEVRCYFRVVTATTTVTVQITYTDATGAQTTTPVNAASEGVGSYSVMPIVVASAANQPITVKAQAGTANQVFVSASIVG